jgi:hypothetical protein
MNPLRQEAKSPMTEEGSSEKESVTETLFLPEHYKYWVFAYALLVSGIYQSTYWGFFDVNVFAYAGLQDVIRLSLYPLATAIPLLMGVVFIRERWLRGLISDEAPVRSNRKAILLGGIFYFLCFVILCFGAFLVWAGLWVILFTCCFPSILVGMLISSSLLEGRFSPVVRPIVLAALPFGIGSALTLGYIAGAAIKYGHDYQVAKLPEELRIQIPEVSPDETLRYLGQIGEFEFFWSDGHTILIPTKEIRALSLTNFHEKLTLRSLKLDPQ